MEKDKKNKLVRTSQKAIRKYNLNSPGQIVKMANTVKAYVVKNKLYVPIKNKNYVMVEGWQFAGGLLGFSPNINSVKDLTPEKSKNYKWFAHAQIIRNKDDKVIGSGFALCSKEESKKKSFDEYAILSMAQTRAIGKAFRNLIGWIMKLAGYEPTPAEEMKNFEEGKYRVVKEVEVEKTKGGKLEELKSMLKGNTDIEKVKDLKKRTGTKLSNFKGLTDNYIGRLIATLLNKEVK